MMAVSGKSNMPGNNGSSGKSYSRTVNPFDLPGLDYDHMKVPLMAGIVLQILHVCHQAEWVRRTGHVPPYPYREVLGPADDLIALLIVGQGLSKCWERLMTRKCLL
jgi:hypothetical protein